MKLCTPSDEIMHIPLVIDCNFSNRTCNLNKDNCIRQTDNRQWTLLLGVCRIKKYDMESEIRKLKRTIRNYFSHSQKVLNPKSQNIDFFRNSTSFGKIKTFFCICTLYKIIFANSNYTAPSTITHKFHDVVSLPTWNKWTSIPNLFWTFPRKYQTNSEESFDTRFRNVSNFESLFRRALVTWASSWNTFVNVHRSKTHLTLPSTTMSLNQKPIIS